jgi:hypothetical protein
MKRVLLLFFFGALVIGVHAQTPQTCWSLTGNTGTSSSNFIGTTDNAPLIFKTNNTERMRLLPNVSYLGVGTDDPQALLHLNYYQPGGKVFTNGNLPEEEDNSKKPLPLVSLLRLTSNAFDLVSDFRIYSISGNLTMQQTEKSNFNIFGCNFVIIRR